MINNFNRFLRDQLNNNKYTYTYCEGEIYRHSAKISFDQAFSENNFIIAGEGFFDMDDSMSDEHDLFYKNTFKFHKNSVNESNLVMTYAEHVQSRKLFMAFLENVLLIEKHTRDKENLTLETKRFYFTNVFYLRPDNNQPIALPYLSMKTANDIVLHEFAYPKLQDVNKQVQFIHEQFREIYFKPILDKTIVEMSEDEKKTIIMYYQ